MFMNASGKSMKKFRDIARFLKGSGHFLTLALAAGMLTTLFNALTPQIIRFTVDHLTGEGTSGDGIISRLSFHNFYLTASYRAIF